MRRKTISILLALVLCMSLAVPAFGSADVTINGGKATVTRWDAGVFEISNAISQQERNGDVFINVKAPATITLLRDVEHGDPYGNLAKADLTFEGDNLVDVRITAYVSKASGPDHPPPSEHDISGTRYSTGTTFILAEPGSYTFYGSTYFFIVQGDDATPPPPPANDEIKVLLNGEAISFDQPPIIENGRTLVPLRAIFEAMGADVEWDNATRTVTAELDGVNISLTIGSNILYRNGEAVTLDVPAKIEGGRTLVPVRAIAESFGAEVGWVQSTRTVTIEF